MELRHLRYFVAVAEQRSFSRAAEKICIAQPALSKQIRQLEEEIGADLFIRGTRPLCLTEAGVVFMERAQQILASVDSAALEARRRDRGQAGELTIGYVGSSMYTLLPTAVNRFRDLHPGVALALHEMTAGHLRAALEAGEIDVALTRPPFADDQTFGQKVVVSEPFVVALSDRHALAKRRSIPLGELSDEPFILHPRFPSPSVTDVIVSACLESGFAPVAIQEACHMQTIIGLVASGLGVTLVPASVADQPWRGVSYLPITPPGPMAPLALNWRKGKLSAVQQNFIDTVTSVADEYQAIERSCTDLLTDLQRARKP